MSAPSEYDVAARVLEEILAAARVPVAFQPIVDLASGDTVGFEALARPPGGVAFTDLVALAAATGEVDRLDWIARVSALADPGRAQLPGSLAWFVNVEQRSILAPVPPGVPRPTGPWHHVVAEITERAAGSDPVGLIRGVHRLRTFGAGVALDDVGTTPDSLALLAVLAPDVVKVERAVLGPDPSSIRVVEAVAAHVERSGARLLVEGIEDDDDLAAARVAGASLGQGYRFGRPGPLPATLPPPRRPVGRRPDSAPVPDDATPFLELAAGVATGVATRATVAAISRHLEDQVEHHREPLALLVSFQDGEHFTAEIEKRYRQLAERYAFVATFGPDLPDLSDVKVQRGEIADGDGLLEEWNLVVVGPWYGAALTARDTGRGEGAEREYEYLVTRDRAKVERAARVLAHRLTREA